MENKIEFFKRATWPELAARIHRRMLDFFCEARLSSRELTNAEKAAAFWAMIRDINSYD